MYSSADYKKGSPEFSLLRNQRLLIIKALIRSNWDLKKAFKLNFPKENICLNSYNKMTLNHHISVKNKTFKKLKDIQ